MKITRLLIHIIILQILAALSCVTIASAYWVWTPETKKFLNPKYAVKDSPKEQYDWAMSFYEAKDYQRAANEFDKLTKNYEFSEYAGKAQYYVGLSYENMGKYYLAFQAYQKAIDNFPHIDNIDEIIARQFNIANIYEGKATPKVLGTDIMTPTDRVVEIYRKVVENAPYGKLADTSLFNMGEVLKKAERYDEAVLAFQKILDEYPDSQFTERARYEVAYCAYKSSLKPAYDQESTDKAIKAFSEFSQENKDDLLTKEADKTIQRLKDKAAEKSLLTAQFYEKIHKKESAIIYYKDIIDRYPDCSYVNMAKKKIEDLKSGKRPARVTTELPEKGGLFGLWPKAEPAKAPEQATAASSAGEVKSAEPTAPISKSKWTPFNFGKKDSVKPKPKEAPKEKKGWLSFDFWNKPVSTPAAAMATAEAPQPSANIPMQEATVTPPVPAAEVSQVPAVPVSAPASAVPAASATPPVETSPAETLPPKADNTASQSVPVSTPAQTTVSTPATCVATPPVKAVMPQSGIVPISTTPPPVQKNNGWTPFNIFGFGKESANTLASKSPAPVTPPPVVVASAPTAEPLPMGSGTAQSQDDPNVEKYYSDLY